MAVGTKDVAMQELTTKKLLGEWSSAAVAFKGFVLDELVVMP